MRFVLPGPGRFREVRGTISEVLVVFCFFFWLEIDVPETGNVSKKLHPKCSFYGVEYHRKWMKVDPFRAHLKLRALEAVGPDIKMDGGGVVYPT